MPGVRLTDRLARRAHQSPPCRSCPRTRIYPDDTHGPEIFQDPDGGLYLGDGFAAMPLTEEQVRELIDMLARHAGVTAGA